MPLASVSTRSKSAPATSQPRLTAGWTNWCRARSARDEFLGAITDRGLVLSALNCSGNLLDPHPERRERCQQVYYDTIRVAKSLGLDIVITQSGCPGAPDGGTYPNWVTATWPAEYVECGRRQWAEEVTPFWREAGRFAADHGMKIAIEMHHGMVAYNPRSLVAATRNRR